MRIAVVDTETTGTDPRVHQMWELGLVVVDADDPARDPEPFWCQVAPDLSAADPGALQVGRYFERAGTLREDSARRRSGWSTAPHESALAGQAAHKLAGTRFASCNVSFDVPFVQRWLREQGTVGAWHYSPIDIKSLCYGCHPELLGASTGDIALGMGVDVDQALAWFDLHEEGRHSAIADAYIAACLLYEAMGWGRMYGSRCNDHYGGYRCEGSYGHAGRTHRDRDTSWQKDDAGNLLLGAAML